MMLRRLAAIAIAVPGLLAGPGPAGHAAAAADLDLSYEAWKGGLYVMRIDAALHRDARAYRIVMTAETDGLIGWLFPYRLETRAQGLADGDGVVPQRFEVAAHDGDATTRRRLLFRPDGGLDVTESPPEAARSDAPPAALLRGRIDPASALLALAERFARGGRCAGRAAVFDGRRRYDLALADLGAETLGRSRYSLFAGSARRCRATVTRLSGFRSDGTRLGRMPEKIDVWLAPPVSGAPPLPVRLEGESSYGSLVVHLVAAQARAQVTDRP